MPSIASRIEQGGGRCRVVWWLRDGKAGHENQVRGLLCALGERAPLDIHPIDVRAIRRPWLQWLAGRFPAGRDLPAPVLIIGAGHATHLPMLAARRAYGGRVVVLMKPTLPLSLFDLAIVPEHDGVAASGRVLVTRGVLNNVVDSGEHELGRGLLLIGGPSRHHDWSNEQMVAQVAEVVGAEPGISWTLTDSRRTPAIFLPLLRSRELPNLEIVPCRQTAPEWLPEQLARVGRVWVSEDSVSMLYEALTSGAAVGLLPVVGSRGGRLADGIARLVADGLVTPLEAWRSGCQLQPATERFNEARRCAARMEALL